MIAVIGSEILVESLVNMITVGEKRGIGVTEIREIGVMVIGMRKESVGEADHPDEMIDGEVTRDGMRVIEGDDKCSQIDEMRALPLENVTLWELLVCILTCRCKEIIVW